MATYSSATNDATITTASLAAGAGRIMTAADNSGSTRWEKIGWGARMATGAVAPTADTLFTFWLVINDRDVTTEYVTDGFGKVDAAVSAVPTNARQIGSMKVTANANTQFYTDGEFNLSPLADGWAVIIMNETDQTSSVIEADGFFHWEGAKAA